MSSAKDDTVRSMILNALAEGGSKPYILSWQIAKWILGEEDHIEDDVVLALEEVFREDLTPGV